MVGAESHEYSHTAGCLCAPELTQEIDPNWDGYWWDYGDIYNLDTFTIDGTTSYDFCEKTTWKQWVRSSYNVDGFFINDDNMIELPDGSILSSWTDTGSGNIYADDFIDKRINYMLFG